MPTNNIYAVIVLYNTSLTDSITCQNLLKIKNHKIHTIIVDNSVKKNNNDQLSNKLNFTYLSMHGNVGLSKAYNKVLDYLQGKDGLVIWFDDDTNVTQEYFDKLEEAVNQNSQVDVFVPIIMGQDKKFWSPNKARFFKNKQIKSINEKIDNSDFNAINSCTAVRLRDYKSYRYNEKLFLDHVDQNFFDEQRKLNRKFFVLKTVIHHNFSLKKKNISEKDLEKRYKLRISDFKTYCLIQNKSLFLCKTKILLWGLRETVNTRRMETINFFMKELGK